MAEARQPLSGLTDEALGSVLRDLGAAVAFPSPSSAGEPGAPDLAARARARIVALNVHPAPTARRRFSFSLRPMRRSLVLAIALLLIVAAIVGAVGLGLPGLRIVFGDAPTPGPGISATASPGSLSPLGAQLGIGTALPLDEVERLAGFDVILPSDPAIGPPDVAYLSGQRVTLVWAGRPGLPSTGDHGIGLLISQFQGHVEEGYYKKIVDTETVLTRVTVDGAPGYWISGPPHFFYYIDPNGEVVDDAHREVGDVLIWSTGELTYRLESGLDMAGSIRLAESLD